MLLTGLEAPTEGVFHVEPNIECHIDHRNLGSGSLHVAQSRLCWISCSEQHPSLSLDYKRIAIHAVCRDLSQFPREHVYVMIDSELFPEDAEASSDEETGDKDDKCTSIRFVPAASSNLQTIYSAISSCQLLHPDSQDESDDDYEEEGEEDGPLGPLPSVQFENQPYVEQMENGLGDLINTNGINRVSQGRQEDEEEEAMDEDQFEDAM